MTDGCNAAFVKCGSYDRGMRSVFKITAPDEQAYFQMMGMVATSQEIIVADQYDLTIKTGPLPAALRKQLEAQGATIIGLDQ